MSTARIVRNLLMIGAAWAVVALVPFGCGGNGAAEGGDGPLIAVIPKGTTHEFWKAIHAGAVKAAREAGCRVRWKGPQDEGDREAQVRVVEDQIAGGVDGIVLAPTDDKALLPAVTDAVAEKIPVIVIDSGLQGDKHTAFIATDNYRGGQLGARRLGELLGGKGKIIMLRYQEGSASTTKREQGFLDVIRDEFPNVEILSDNLYGGGSETSYEASENLLNRFPELDGAFCPNESTAMGMLRALQDDKRAGKVQFVGFDASTKLVAGLRDGHIHGLVVQNPFRMGELGVQTMLAHLRGETVDKVIDTGCVVVTKENMTQPEVAELLAPDLDKWLK